jgi:hypothetical protein
MEEAENLISTSPELTREQLVAASDQFGSRFKNDALSQPSQMHNPRTLLNTESYDLLLMMYLSCHDYPEAINVITKRMSVTHVVPDERTFAMGIDYFRLNRLPSEMGEIIRCLRDQRSTYGLARSYVVDGGVLESVLKRARSTRNLPNEVRNDIDWLLDLKVDKKA